MSYVENKIVDRLIAGDEVAWDNIYKEYNPKLFTICQAYLGNSPDIEDLIQDTWLKFVTHLRRFSFKKGLAPILYQIMRNNCRNYLKHKKAIGRTTLTGFNENEGKYYNIDISDAGAIWDAYKPKRKIKRRRKYVGRKRVYEAQGGY